MQSYVLVSGLIYLLTPLFILQRNCGNSMVSGESFHNFLQGKLFNKVLLPELALEKRKNKVSDV